MAPKKKPTKPAAKMTAKANAAKSVAKMATKPSNKAAIQTPQTHTINGPHHHHEGMCCAEDHSASKAQSCWPSCCMMGCPLFTTLLKPAFWLGSIIAFVVIMTFDMFWHGQLMAQAYQNTLHLWRPEAEVMANFMAYCYLMHALSAAAITALVLLIGRTDWWGGTVAGALAMAPAAAASIGSYVWLPLPSMEIPLMWAAGQLLAGALVGVVLVALLKAFPKLSGCPTCCK